MGLLLLVVLEMTDHLDGLSFSGIIECRHNKIMLYKTGEAVDKISERYQSGVILPVFRCKQYKPAPYVNA